MFRYGKGGDKKTPLFPSFSSFQLLEGSCFITDSGQKQQRGRHWLFRGFPVESRKLFPHVISTYSGCFSSCYGFCVFTCITGTNSSVNPPSCTHFYTKGNYTCWIFASKRTRHRNPCQKSKISVSVIWSKMYFTWDCRWKWSRNSSLTKRLQAGYCKGQDTGIANIPVLRDLPTGRAGNNRNNNNNTGTGHCLVSRHNSKCLLFKAMNDLGPGYLKGLLLP